MLVLGKEKRIYETFQTQGYAVLKKVVARNIVKQVLQQTQLQIRKCAKELNYSYEEYLGTISRWQAPSPIISDIYVNTVGIISKAVELVTLESIALQKLIVICKNRFCTGAVPFHQDISYARDHPYQLSGWLALNDVDCDAGPLEVIPGSHQNPIQKAVDFWSPEYQPDSKQERHLKKLAIKAGDLVVFDSRLWHGSHQNKSLASRFAMVTRWSSINWIPPANIPKIEPRAFGMWNCEQKAEELLKEGLQRIGLIKTNSFVEITVAWIEVLQKPSLPFECNIQDAVIALQRAKILHLAHEIHNGGDATGTVYKNLWKVLLSPLSTYLEKGTVAC